MKPHLSIVSPVFKAEDIIPDLVKEITGHIKDITTNYEIILVDDGSPDNSWAAIEKECNSETRVKGIKLSRNFGQHYAITAGLDYVQGEWIVVMDCDLQDKPSEIPNLYTEAKKGYDIVLARRVKRRDSVNKRVFSTLFNKILGYLTGTEQDSAVANFGLYHCNVINAIRSMREQIRFFPTMVKWVGFKKTYLDVEHGTRESGKSSYTFNKLLALAFDILLANSEKPIRLIVKAGFLISSIAFLVGLGVVISYFMGKIEVLGYTSLILSVWFLGGMIMVMLGIIGLYIGKTFQGVKNRPIYIIAGKENFDEN